MVLKRNARAATTTPALRTVTRTASTQTAQAAPAASDSASAPATPDTKVPTPQEPAGVTITSTAVGLFRQSSPPLQVGDTVKNRQVVAIVESLKIPNEITTRVAGRIVEVLATEGQGVEYGQPLLVIVPESQA
jgi:acetyl-CoA carboxylase biotin carboxyl carrier protein